MCHFFLQSRKIVSQKNDAFGGSSMTSKIYILCSRAVALTVNLSGASCLQPTQIELKKAIPSSRWLDGMAYLISREAS